VLKATQISGVSAGGAPVSTVTGVYLSVGAARRARGRLDVRMDERREKLAARRSTRAA
jgi:hypothetical protein